MGNSSRIIWRFTTGRPLGDAKTNATFFQRADKITHHSGRASRWDHKSHAERAAWRLGTLTTVSVTAWGEVTHPLATDVTVGLVAGSGVAYAARKASRAVSHRRHRRRLVAPLMRSLAGPLSLPLGARADRWLIVPRRPQRPGQITRVYLPDHWAGETVQQLALTRIIERWIGVPTEAIRWHLTEAPRFAEFTPTPQPRDAVAWKLSDDPYRLHIGENAAGDDVWLETLTDNPSSAFVGGSGSGKTTALTLPLVHARRHGVLVDIIDLKRMSFTERSPEHPNGIAGDPRTELGTVTGVRVHTTLESSLRALAEFLASATSVALMQQAGQDTSDIPARLLMMDEAGSFLGGVKSWWKGPGGQKTPNVVPFWLHVALMQGRALSHRLVMGAHQLNLGMFGDAGSDVRDLFSGRLLIGTASNERWITTFGRMRKPAYDSKIKGRGAFGGLGESPSVVQVAYVPQAEANSMLMAAPMAPEWFDQGCSAPWITEDFILEVEQSYSAGRWVPGWEWFFRDIDADDADGAESEPEPERPNVSVSAPAPADTAPVQDGSGTAGPGVAETATPLGVLRSVPDLPPEPPELAGVTLSKAIDDGILKISLSAARKASVRPGFPEPIGQAGTAYVYDPVDLMRWANNRPRAVG